PAEPRAPQPIPLFFRETWKDTAAIPVTQAVVANPDLELRIYGASKDDMTVNNEGGVPHVWTGLCPAGCAVVLRHKESLVDLTGKARIKWYTKTSARRTSSSCLKATSTAIGRSSSTPSALTTSSGSIPLVVHTARS